MTRVPKVSATHPLVPLALLALVLASAWTAALVAPAAWRGPASLATACVLILVAFVRLPKPTLLVFAVVVLFYDTLGRWIAPDIRHVDEVVVPALVVLAAWRIRPWRHGMFEPLRDGALGALMLLGIISSVVNGVPLAIWAVSLFLLVKVFAFLYVVVWHDFNASDVRQFMPLVAGIGFVVLGLGAIELINPAVFQATLNLTTLSVPRGQLPSIKSIFWHPFLFSWFTAFVGLYLLAGYVIYRRWWLLLAGLAFAAGTVLGGRRRAIAGLALALLGGFGRSVRDRFGWRPAARAWWPVAAGSLLVALALLPGLVGLLQLTVDEAKSDDGQANNARVALYGASLLIGRDYFPLGAGLGQFGSGGSRSDYSPLYERYGLDQIDGLSRERSNFITDAFWPRILGETGFGGLLAGLAFSAALLLGLWRAAAARVLDPLLRAFLLGTMMVFLQALVETLASSMFNSPPRIYLLLGAVGIALSLHRALKDNDQPC